MSENIQKFGFSYFSSPDHMVANQVETWIPTLKGAGASFVVFKSGFECGLPEDPFLLAVENGLDPIVHFTEELPITRKFNDVALLIDAYAKRGCKAVIIGDKPNTKGAWVSAGWHYENLVDHFLDRFIPIANYSVQIGLDPILPAMQPGGDYWDTAFIELVIAGLKRRKLDAVLEKLILSSYGFTFNKPLSWGKGGPEVWSASKPYLTPEGQEDQLGFHHFEWAQSQAFRILGRKLSVFILDSGSSGMSIEEDNSETVLENIQRILNACRDELPESEEELKNYPAFTDAVAGCSFDMSTLSEALAGNLETDVLMQLFGNQPSNGGKTIPADESRQKIISQYLLLPCHESGVSDVVLNKVRPLIRKYHPTVGFSVNEALNSQKVMIYPDPILFPDEQINALREAGCSVEILPESGIEIATSLQ